MSQGIWIFEEHDIHGTKNITLELLSEGQKLARRFKEELCVCVLGHQLEDDLSSLSKFGAVKAFVVDDPLLSKYDVDTYSFILGDLVEEFGPSILMMGATPLGSELAPRVAARCGLPCITEVNQIKGKSKNLKITKFAYNDQLYATIKPGSKRPVVITIPPGETDIVKSDEAKELEVVKKDFKLAKDVKQTQFRKFIKGDPRTINIEEADIIVAVGNGVNKEALPIVQEFADSLRASIGGSRVAVDKNVIPYERQIGITGKTVMPKLLVACGISGAYEFTDGMRDSDIVIAINTDEKAGIFKVATLPIKGDLNEIIPLVTHQLKSYYVQNKGKDDT